MPDPHDSDGSGTDAAVVAEIAETRETYERAEAAGSFAVVADRVAPGFVALPPGMDAIEGRDTWAARFDEWLADAPDRDYHIAYESVEVLVGDDLAVDRGVARDRGTDEAGDPVEREFKYVMVYQREADAWLLARLIYNTT